MKRVVIDARMITPVPHGFARYVSGLAKGLREVRVGSDYEPVFLVKPGSAHAALGSFRTHELAAPFLHPREMIEIPKVLKQLEADLYHSPTFSSLVGSPCPWIVTIHDLNHLTYGGLKERLYYRAVLKPFAKRAAAVVTVSEFSRGEISTWLEIPRSDIEIAYNAIDPELMARPEEPMISETLQHFGLERGRFFLCLSNPKPHKNVNLLAEAYATYSKQCGNSRWPLVLSVDGFKGMPGIISEGSLCEPEGRALLHSAGALVFPSLYEGFGLPPVEAASIGTPVVASKIPPHEEGLQDMEAGEVLWVAPRDFHGWVSALHHASQGQLIGTSETTRSKIRERYSLGQLGRNMDRVYRRVLGL